EVAWLASEAKIVPSGAPPRSRKVLAVLALGNVDTSTPNPYAATMHRAQRTTTARKMVCTVLLVVYSHACHASNPLDCTRVFLARGLLAGSSRRRETCRNPASPEAGASIVDFLDFANVHRTIARANSNHLCEAGK